MSPATDPACSKYKMPLLQQPNCQRPGARRLPRREGRPANTLSTALAAPRDKIPRALGSSDTAAWVNVHGDQRPVSDRSESGHGPPCPVLAQNPKVEGNDPRGNRKSYPTKFLRQEDIRQLSGRQNFPTDNRRPRDAQCGPASRQKCRPSRNLQTRFQQGGPLVKWPDRYPDSSGVAIFRKGWEIGSPTIAY